MKTLLKLSFVFLIFLVLVYSVSFKPVTAQQTCPSTCLPSCDVPSQAICATYCTGCVTIPGQRGGTDINCENKIHNPALSSLLCKFNGPEFLQTALSTFISLGIIIASVAFFFMIMLGGIKWITSGGDKNHLETAQKQISSGITGLAILFSIFAIIKVVEVLFGISILTFTLPRLGN